MPNPAQRTSELYCCRWEIEVFFKQIKQTLQLADFLGNSANAVAWQIRTALLTYVLLRCCAWLNQWPHSFTRLFARLRSARWQKLELRSLLEIYGTAGAAGAFWAHRSRFFWPDSFEAVGQPIRTRTLRRAGWRALRFREHERREAGSGIGAKNSRRQHLNLTP